MKNLFLVSRRSSPTIRQLNKQKPSSNRFMKNLIILTGLNWLLLTSTQGANLVTYWNFDEPTGSTTMYDSYGVNTGTLGSTAVSGAAGKFGNALSINRAANGAMGMTASTIGFPTGTKPYAISYWVFNPSFVPGATADEPHFAFGDAANGKENVVFNRDAFGGGKISYYNRDLVLPNGFFVNNQWQLIVVQWDGTTRKAYADGVLKASDSLGPNTSAGTIFSMGGDIQRPTYGTCSAIFDDFAVWDDALSEMEISILWNDGVGNPASVLAPPARDPRIHTAPSALFGDLRSLGPSPGSITNVLRLTNYGATKSLNIASLNLTGDNADLYAVLPPVPTMIAPGEGAQVQIVFTPSIIGGNFTAALEVASDDPGAPLTTVSLNAMVLGDPTIGVSPTRLFGDLTSLGGTPGIITNALTITNTGITRSLNISSITPTGENADLYTVLPPMPAPIPPGGQAEVAVAFSPLAAWGNFNASLEIASDDPLKPITTIVMNAVVASDPQIVLIPTNTPFGRFTYASADQIPATISRTVTVMNAGRVNPLDVTLQGVIGLDAGNYTLETANIMMTIPPGGQSNIVVTLSPGAGGEFEAALMVASSDPDLEEATLYPPLSASVRAVEPATLLAFYSFDDPLDPFKDDSGNGATITGTRGTAPVWVPLQVSEVREPTPFRPDGCSRLLTSTLQICP